MRSRRNRRSHRPFHLAWIFVIGIAPVFTTWFLIPRDLEMAERLAADDHPYRALVLLKELIALESSEPLNEEMGTWEFPAMEMLFAKDGEQRTRGDKETRMLRILLQLSDEPGRAFDMFRNNPKALDSSVARDFYNIMANTALRQNNPPLAAQIYLSLDESHGLPDGLMMKAIEACRFSGSPKPALDLLYDHAKREGVEVSQLSRELRMLVISLHRELNEGAKAFTLLKEEFERAKTEALRTELIHLLATTATQSNLFAESLPLLQEYVAKTDAGILSWEALAVRNEPHPSDADFIDYGSTMAQQFLWSGKIEAAFEMYRKLALLDSGDPLEKCVLIAPWVDRSRDLGALLASIENLPRGKGYENLLVDSHCIEGEFDQAEKLLRHWIAEGHPEQIEMRQNLADLVFEQRRYEEAEELYSEALEARMTNPDPGELLVSQIGLARTAAITGDFELALKHYREIPEVLYNHKTLGDYLYLAKSMNATEDILRGLKIELKLGKNNTSSHSYLSLADACESSGDLEQAQEWLDKGLEACPGSKKIVLQAAELLRKRGRQNEAIEYLFKHYDHDDLRLHSKILDLALSTQRQTEVLDFLHLKDPAAPAWPTSLRLTLADVYESKLDYSTALVIYESLNREGFEAPKVRLRAQIAFERQRMREAWNLQKEYVAMIANPSPDELVFLGDLNWYHGQDDAADKAYNAALAILNQAISHDPNAKPINPLSLSSMRD